MSSQAVKQKISAMSVWDKTVFIGSVIGVLFMLFFTFYRNHISKELVIENYRLKENVAKKDSIIHMQQFTIDSLRKK